MKRQTEEQRKNKKVATRKHATTPFGDEIINDVDPIDAPVNKKKLSYLTESIVSEQYITIVQQEELWLKTNIPPSV